MRLPKENIYTEEKVIKSCRSLTVKQIEEKDSAKEREGRSTGRGSQGEQMLQEENGKRYDVSQVVKDVRVKSDC